MILMMLLMLTELLKLPEQLTTPTEPLLLLMIPTELPLMMPTELLLMRPLAPRHLVPTELLLTKGTGLLVTMIQAQDQET